MVNTSEYRKYISLYSKKMKTLLEQEGINIPECDEGNIVALRWYMEEYEILDGYPTLERVLNAVGDCSASWESRLNAMRNNISDAFKKVEKVEVNA